MMKCSTHRITIGILIALMVCMANAAWAQDTEKININTASAEQLATLEKIGPQYARRIIDYRNENGPFETPEDLMKVKGIGPKTWDAIKDRIVVN